MGWKPTNSLRGTREQRATFGKRSYQLQLHPAVVAGCIVDVSNDVRWCGVPCAARVILPLLLFIIGLFTAGSCQKSTIKRSIPCAHTRATESCAESI